MRLLCIIILSISQIFAQNSTISPLGIPEKAFNKNKECTLLELGANHLFSIWSEDQLYGSHSTDGGESWSERFSIVDEEVSNIQMVKLASGRIVITYYITPAIYFTYSDDNGLSWEEPQKISTFLSITNGSSLKVIGDKIFLIVSRSKDSYYYTSSDGISWDSRQTLHRSPNNISGLYLGQSSAEEFKLYTIEREQGIYKLFSHNNSQVSNNWINKTLVLQADSLHVLSRLRGEVVGENLYLVFENDYPSIDSVFQKDIYYIRTINQTQWDSVKHFTRFKKSDFNHNIVLIDGRLKVVFQSYRKWNEIAAGNSEKPMTWFGDIESAVDFYTPPYMSDIQHQFRDSDNGIDLTLNLKVIDEDGINSVYLQVDGNNKLELFDDGLHNDSEADDFIFGNVIENLSTNTAIVVGVMATDINLNSEFKLLDTLFKPEFDYDGKAAVILNNRSSLPIEIAGKIADVKSSSAKFDGGTVIFGGGFGLSGYTNDNLWANGVYSTGRIEDYISGPVDSTNRSDFVKLYQLQDSDPDFGNSWQEWKNAVELGAKYYDGDNDGIYNPKDLNGNNKWDINEDRPDLLGNTTLWTVFHDGVQAQSRLFSDIEPQGIEIRQTIYSFDFMKDVFFIRYEIENTGLVSEMMESVYFSFMYDFDIGNYLDDLIFSSKEDHSIGVYNYKSDEIFGEMPPSTAIVLLQGPHSYIPGISYTDNNNNNKYEPTKDTPILNASSNFGELIGISEIVGATNLIPTSSLGLMSSGINQLEEPENAVELRNLQRGLNTFGNLHDPCDDFTSIMIGTDCKSVNPKFMYTGNPIFNIGWINNDGNDYKAILSVGPFNLEQNKPQTIIGALVTQRYIDPNNPENVVPFKSAEFVKARIRQAKNFYNTNFKYDIVGVDSNPNTIFNKYKLYQNFPNPFNPITTIRYEIPSGNISDVSLKIFDVLGREISVLVNKKHQPGEYEIYFDATQLPSGVYFYELVTNQFKSVKKMILLK